MNPDSYGCDARNEITDMRCGVEHVVTIEDTGDRYCQYCCTDYLSPEQLMAFKSLKRVGMV